MFCGDSCLLLHWSRRTETAGVKPAIPGGSLTQSAAVDETVLPAASQNVTAYAPDTETTQGFSRYAGVPRSPLSLHNHCVDRLAAFTRGPPLSGLPPCRMDTSGPSAVRETPEKDRRQTGSSDRGPVVSNATKSRIGAEVPMSSHATGAKSRSKRPVLRTTDDSRLMLKHPPLGNQHKSPQKRANSLTDYFKPVSKKR